MASDNGLLQPATTEIVIPDFETVTRSSVPFARSLQLVVNTLEHKAGADVACLYIFESNRLNLAVSSGRLKRSIDGAQVQLSEQASLWLSGLQSPEDIPHAAEDWRVGSFLEVKLTGLSRLTVAPLRIGEQLTAIITVGWKLDHRNQVAGSLIDGLTAAAAVLLARIPQTEAAADLVAEIAQVEAELAERKIGDHAHQISGELRPVEPAVGMVHRQVQRVLEGTSSPSALKQQLQTIRRQVQDRKLVDMARTCRSDVVHQRFKVLVG